MVRGWRATMATRDLPDGLAAGLVETGIAVLDLAQGSQDEAADIASAIDGRATLVVGDHYGVGADWFTGMRRRVPGAALMAIDDLADRSLPVDLLLNQNLGASADAYATLVPQGARILTGPAYALVRPEFAAARARGRTRDGSVERVLVFISGADAPDMTSRAVTALDGIGCPVDVVVGAAYPHLAELREIVAGQPPDPAPREHRGHGGPDG